jgi:hypothetical protein
LGNRFPWLEVVVLGVVLLSVAGIVMLVIDAGKSIAS